MKITETKVIVVSQEQGFVGYEAVPLEKWKLNVKSDTAGTYGERLLTHAFLMDSFRKIMGRTLTVIDSSILDKTQNKAMKDLVRGIFSDEMGFAAEWAFEQKMFDNLEDADGADAVSIEEALGVK